MIDFLFDESGVTLIEYGLIAALIAVGIILLLTGTGGQLTIVWTRIADCLASPPGPSC